MLLLLLIVTLSMPTALKSPKTPLPSFARGDDVEPAADMVGLPTETTESSRLMPV